MQEFIELEKVEITDKAIRVYSSHTSYVDEVLPEKIDVKALLAEFKALCAKAKSLGFKVSHRNGKRKEVADNAALFEQQYSEYLAHFNIVAADSKRIFVDKKLPVGTADNEELKAMREHSWAMNRLHYSSTVFSKVYEFDSRVKQFAQALEHAEPCSEMSFFF